MTATFFAPAKINLWLRIFPPDDTGYHPLDTLFCALELADEIVIEQREPGIQLAVSGADVGPADRNLAYRAADEFFRTTGLPPRIGMRLVKNIPAAAGLGGGSSDAATVLLALNELHDGVLPVPDLMSIAARLGSDVPFFLCGSVMAHATGRGEQLRGVGALPRAAVVIVAPPFPIATADAYRWLDDAALYSSPVSRDNDAMDWKMLERTAQNDFEPVLFARQPALREMKNALLATGAHVAMVSGSGSALFGIYSAEEQGRHAAERLRRDFATAKIILTANRS